MSTERGIATLLTAIPTVEGAGVHLQRVFGHAQAPDLDPFLLLDDFRSDDPRAYLPGFPWHPHRGIETITYMLAGRVEHGDSMGNRGVIGPGGVQWMTAGSGIVHQEMPKGDPDGSMGGLQLWANLPASHKMMPPRYRELTQVEIPAVAVQDGVTARVIAGELAGVQGPVRDIVTEPVYLDLALEPGVSLVQPVTDGHTALAYLLEGRARFGPGEGAPRAGEVGPRTAVVFQRQGSRLTITSGANGARLLLIAGQPIGEPVAWWGPIVMNTQEELQTALREYREGAFLKHQAILD